MLYNVEQIWSYEHIDIARPGLVDCGLIFPRVCRWDNSRSNRQRFSVKFKDLQGHQVIQATVPTLLLLFYYSCKLSTLEQPLQLCQVSDFSLNQ